MKPGWWSRFRVSSKWARLAIVIAIAAAYALVFVPLRPVLGPSTPALAGLFVAEAAWFFGLPGGVIAALVALLLNTLLYNLIGDTGWDAALRHGRALGYLLFLAGGAVLGWLHDLSERLQHELAERQKTERAAQDHAALAEALRETTGLLNSTLDLDEVLKRLLDGVGRVVPHEAATIMLVESGVARVVGQRGYAERGLGIDVLNVRYVVDETANLRHMARCGQYMVIPDIGNFPGWVMTNHTRWIRSYLGVPIRTQDRRVIGFLSLDSDRLGFFSDDQGQRLQVFADQTAIAIENARLHKTLSDRAARLDLIAQVGRKTTSILELDELLRQTVNLIGSTFGYYNAVILMVEGEELVLRAAMLPSAPLPPDPHSRIRLGGKGITTWVAEHGEPLLVPDVSRDERYYFLEETPDTKSELATPIKVRDAVIGVLDVQSNELAAFSSADLSGMQAIADQLAIAIQNARLVDSVRRRQRYLETLSRVNRRTAAERNPQRFMQSLVEALAEEFNYQIVTILPGDDEARQLRIGALAGSGRDLLQVDPATYRQSYDTGLLGWVISHGQPHLARDTTQDPYYVPTPAGATVGSELAVPIRQHEKTVAVLSVSSLDKNRLDELDLEAMTELADGLAISLENVTLNEQVEHHAAEMEQRVAQRTTQLAETMERLQELDRLKSRFVADISHELRTPIASMSVYLDLLERGGVERVPTYLATLREQVNRLSTLVEDILELSRLEMGKLKTTFVQVDLNALVSQVIIPQKARAEAEGLALTFEPGPDLPMLMGDPGQLARMVSNLITNAIKYTPQGKIHTRTYLGGGQEVCLEVRDTGSGVEPEDLAHLFERFYRGKKVGQSNIPGTGLGLAIVKEIVNLHAGWIEVSSQVGEGSTFRVWLPVTRPDSA